MVERTMDRKLVTHLRPKSPGAEAYRILRTNLQFAALEHPLRSLMVTSAIPGEGKSLTCANLAIAFAQADQRVLLIDSDLRRPSLTKMFDLPRTWTGLTSVVLGTTEFEDAVQQGPVPGLTILPGGPLPPNPAEIVSSQRMQVLLQRWQERFDLIILDSPPVLAVTDAAALAPRVDGVLMVIHANKVGHPQARRAKAALEAVGGRLIGIMLDAVPPRGENGYGYYQYYGTKH